MVISKSGTATISRPPPRRWRPLNSRACHFAQLQQKEGEGEEVVADL